MPFVLAIECKVFRFHREVKEPGYELLIGRGQAQQEGSENAFPLNPPEEGEKNRTRMSQNRRSYRTSYLRKLNAELHSVLPFDPGKTVVVLGHFLRSSGPSRLYPQAGGSPFRSQKLNPGEGAHAIGACQIQARTSQGLATTSAPTSGKILAMLKAAESEPKLVDDVRRDGIIVVGNNQVACPVSLFVMGGVNWAVLDPPPPESVCCGRFFQVQRPNSRFLLLIY